MFCLSASMTHSWSISQISATDLVGSFRLLGFGLASFFSSSGLLNAYILTNFGKKLDYFK